LLNCIKDKFGKKAGVRAKNFLKMPVISLKFSQMYLKKGQACLVKGLFLRKTHLSMCKWHKRNVKNLLNFG